MVNMNWLLGLGLFLLLSVTIPDAVFGILYHVFHAVHGWLVNHVKL